MHGKVLYLDIAIYVSTVSQENAVVTYAIVGWKSSIGKWARVQASKNILGYLTTALNFYVKLCSVQLETAFGFLMFGGCGLTLIR